jgi:hypothetical protein
MKLAHKVGLISVMGVGSVLMWLGAPVLWLWLAGQTSKVSGTGMGSILMVLIGIPVTVYAIGKVLARVDERYTVAFGPTDTSATRTVAKWMQSMRNSPSEDEPPTMLVTVMLVSVTCAIVVVGLWFIFFSKGTAGPH